MAVQPSYASASALISLCTVFFFEVPGIRIDEGGVLSETTILWIYRG